MPKFFYTVWIECDTAQHADRVMATRFGSGEFGYEAHNPPEQWAVFDAVTGRQMSQGYDNVDVASGTCRGLNMQPGSGGRYHVRINSGGRWVRY